jgi:membrane-associated phospholipid phosphatase
MVVSRVFARVLRALFVLELHEIVGLLASTLALLVFFIDAGRLDAIMGINGYHWLVVNDVVGMYQNVLTWVFTFVLILLLVLFSVLKKANHQFVQSLAYLVRVLVAFLIMMAIYKVVNFYISVFNPFDRDVFLQHIDRKIFFGKLPAEWLESIVSPWLTYLCSAAYVSWFGFVYATIILMMTHSRRATLEYVCTAIVTFYIGYLTYLFVPAIGPVYTVHFNVPVGGVTPLFTNDPLISRDCFPSLHTGISIVMLIYVWRYRRRWTWLYAPVVMLIIFATQYLRFHYGIDVIAGAALAIAMCQICPLMVEAWEKMRVNWLTTRPTPDTTVESREKAPVNLVNPRW